jgi:serine phosphatase RsbU (regulator of sigma subunit)
VAKSAPHQKHLKLYTEQPPKPVRPPIEAVGCLPELLRAFQAATRCTLRYMPATETRPRDARAWSAPVCVAPKTVTGFLTLEQNEQKAEGEQPKTQSGRRKAERRKPEGGRRTMEGKVGRSIRSSRSASAGPPSIDPDAAQSLAGSIADLLGELLQTRTVLQQREAELAAGVPIVPHREDEKHLATRLEAVLRAGAEVVGGAAAAMYLLDEATSELKLRSSWGLPFDRLTAPARPLQGAIADLEALLGHAVVLNDPDTMDIWNAPEDFPTAVAVPIATPTTLLGTLWVFCNERRDFSDQETNILEVVAGRLAADLEREMLLRAGLDGAMLQKQIGAAERLQRNELPTIPPLLDDWDVAGWTAQAQGVGGAFHDWFSLPNGLLAVAVGRAAEQGVAGAMTANAVKTAIRSHARYHRQSERILQQVNLTLWTGSAGDQHAAAFCGLVETATGRVCCSSAGRPSVLRLQSNGWQSLTQSSPCLGEGPETDFDQFGHELQPGEMLLILANGAAGCSVDEAELAEAMQGKLQLSAEELVVAAREFLDAHAASPEGQDRTILVVKRTTA